MAISFKDFVALFRNKKPTFAEALRASGFQPARTASIRVEERRNRETLQRRRPGAE